MNKLFTAFFALAVAFHTSAQHYCGFDAMKQQWCAHAQHQAALDETEDRIYSFLTEENDERGGGMIYTIPVVVHIIHENGAENIPDEQVEDAIDWLNEAYSNSGYYSFDGGINIPIRFCLAHVDPQGNYHSGINRVVSSLTTVSIPSQEVAVKSLSQWNSSLYMNIWVVGSLIRDENNTGLLGNSTLPAMHGTATDGIIIEAAFVGGLPENNKVLIHEVGHYLGLFHTFEGGCPNSNCLQQGDRVCDTPPDNTGQGLCSNNTNSCSTDEEDTSANNPYRPINLGGLGDQPDMTENYMDYSALTCYKRFTQGQCERMVAALLQLRSSLLDGDRCNPPCEIPIVMQITASAGFINLGQSVTFLNTSQNITGTTWYVNEQVVSTSNNFLFTPTATGSYFVEALLNNSEQGCAVEAEFLITVLCPSAASFTTSAPNALPGQTVQFENTSLNAISYQWLVNGNEVSAENNYSTSFDILGSYEVCLVAGNGACSTTSCQFIQVGTCSTGNEARRWLTYTDGPGINDYFFGASGTTTNFASTPYSEGKSTICDANGNLLFTSDCQNLYNSNLQVTPNGSGLMGGFSAREGALFVRAPGSDNLYYLFTLDHNENNFANGLRYHLVDRSLDNGMGDVVEGYKNILIAHTQTETMAAIRHCNYRDFWLLVYNQVAQQYQVWLVTDQGIASEPIIFNWSNANFSNGLIYYRDFSVSPRGDMFMHDDDLFAFDTSNGTITHIIQFPYDIVAYSEFSASGKYLYHITGMITPTLRQVNTQLPANLMVANQYTATIPITQVYADMRRTPQGEILMPNIFGGTLDRIKYPNFYGDAMEVELGFITGTAFTNGFGNYYHAYMSLPLIVNGPDLVCRGAWNHFSIHGCPQGNITWQLPAQAQWVETGYGEIDVYFTESGNYTISATLETECGPLPGSLAVQVLNNTVPDLGPDTYLCTGQSMTLDAGAGMVQYTWSTGSPAQTITVSQPGTYVVYIVDPGGCGAEDEITILGVIAPEINLGPDFQICDNVVVLNAGNNFLDYTWQDGTTGPLYTVYEAGTYTVSATLPCPASDTVVVLPCHDGVSDAESQPVIALYPNPTSGVLHVVLPAAQGYIQVRDLTGRIVIQQKVTDTTMLVSTEALAPSMYMLVWYAEKLLQTAPFMVLK